MTNRRSETDRRARQGQRLGRVLKLLCLIQARGEGWNLDSLAKELGCSRKTVQRDLHVLEAAGIPYFWDERDRCYRIRRDFRLGIVDPPAPPSERPVGSPPAANTRGELTAEHFAERSRQSAERLLPELERLVDVLDQLLGCLGRPAPPSNRQIPDAE